MANLSSSKKAIRKIKSKTEVNKNRRNRVRTYIKRVELAIEAGDQEKALSEYRLMQPELHRSVNKNLMHKNAAARKLSRLSKRIKNMQAA